MKLYKASDVRAAQSVIVCDCGACRAALGLGGGYGPCRRTPAFWATVRRERRAEHRWAAHQAARA